MSSNHHSSSVLYSTLSIAIVLFLLAVYGLLFLHASNVTNLLKEKINIIVELADDHAVEREDVMAILADMEGVKEGTVRFIPKEEATVLMAEFLSEFSVDTDLSPFKDVVVYNLQAMDYSEELIDQHRQKLEKRPEVLDVYSENETVNMVKTNIHNLSYITLIIGLILVILALAIVYNTIKLKLHSDRMEIKTMQLVGAKRGFIARPYIKESLRIATGAFVIVTVFILIMGALLIVGVTEVLEIINWFYVVMVMISVYLFGVILTVGIARFVVKGYLDSKTNELI